MERYKTAALMVSGKLKNRARSGDLSMLPLDKEQEVRLALELATKRQEHSDLDAAIETLAKSGLADATLIQRLKKRKLVLKDRIVQLERILLPDIIA
jgi:hypothetical protein